MNMIFFTGHRPLKGTVDGSQGVISEAFLGLQVFGFQMILGGWDSSGCKWLGIIRIHKPWSGSPPV